MAGTVSSVGLYEVVSRSAIVVDLVWRQAQSVHLATCACWKFCSHRAQSRVLHLGPRVRKLFLGKSQMQEVGVSPRLDIITLTVVAPP